jgi:hypothetical protein
MQNRDCTCEFAHSASKSHEFILRDRVRRQLTVGIIVHFIGAAKRAIT